MHRSAHTESGINSNDISGRESQSSRVFFLTWRNIVEVHLDHFAKRLVPVSLHVQGAVALLELCGHLSLQVDNSVVQKGGSDTIVTSTTCLSFIHFLLSLPLSLSVSFSSSPFLLSFLCRGHAVLKDKSAMGCGQACPQDRASPLEQSWLVATGLSTIIIYMGLL